MFPRGDYHSSDISNVAAREIAFVWLSGELSLGIPRQRLPDVSLNLFLSLRGHVELPDDKTLIGLVPDYVENKVMRSKVLSLDEIVIVITRVDQIASFVRARHIAPRVTV